MSWADCPERTPGRTINATSLLTARGSYSRLRLRPQRTRSVPGLPRPHAGWTAVRQPVKGKYVRYTLLVFSSMLAMFLAHDSQAEHVEAGSRDVAMYEVDGSAQTFRAEHFPYYSWEADSAGEKSAK